MHQKFSNVNDLHYFVLSRHVDTLFLCLTNLIKHSYESVSRTWHSWISSFKAMNYQVQSCLCRTRHIIIVNEPYIIVKPKLMFFKIDERTYRTLWNQDGQLWCFIACNTTLKAYLTFCLAVLKNECNHDKPHSVRYVMYLDF